MLSRGIDVVAGFIPGAGEGARELTKMTVDTLKDQANVTDPLVEHGYLDAQNSHMKYFVDPTE